MEIKTQTKIDHNNRQDFLSTVYHMPFDSINLDKISADVFVLIDAIRSKQYQKIFSNKKFLTLAPVSSIKNFELSRGDFDYLVDDRVYNQIVWPKIAVSDCVLILDCVPLLKYLTIDELIEVFDNLANLYVPVQINFRSVACFVDDNRLEQRIDQFCRLCPKQYVVKKLVYDSDQDLLEIEMLKKQKTL